MSYLVLLLPVLIATRLLTLFVYLKNIFIIHFLQYMSPSFHLAPNAAALPISDHCFVYLFVFLSIITVPIYWLMYIICFSKLCYGVLMKKCYEENSFLSIIIITYNSFSC